MSHLVQSSDCDFAKSSAFHLQHLPSSRHGSQHHIPKDTPALKASETASGTLGAVLRHHAALALS